MLSLWNDASCGVQVIALNGSPGKDDPTSGRVTLHRLIALFEQVALAEGWQAGDALRLWQPRSVYFALEVQGELAGGLQLTLPYSEARLPCFDVWPEVLPQVSPAGHQRSAHIAVLALDPAFRGQPLFFWHLAIEMWRYCVGEGITTLFIEVTPRVLPLYRRLGWPLVIHGQLRRHWGEDCYLCTLGIPEVAEALLRRAENSPYYRQIIAQAFRVTFTAPLISSPKQQQRFIERRRVSNVVREPCATYSYAVAA